ncbi:MAG: menaquinone biosynthesis protein [Bacteroidetes bacterium]|nr:menaquinone biosynthesis protein [Bacteroidota bacterium]
MRSKTRISVVSYLNARPFIYGMEHHLSKDDFHIEKDIPSTCAQKLIDHKADIGLIPVAMISSLSESHLITSFGILADGKVDSVILVSNTPVGEIKKIILDQESRTSVLLAKIVAREFWHIQPEWVQENEESALLPDQEFTGAVIIGDRALLHRSHYKYCYDLAEEWKALTGLPFVFATWVSNRELSSKTLQQLESAFEYGVSHRKDYFSQLEIEYPEINVSHYLQDRILYRMDTRAQEGLELFLEKIQQIKL